MVIYVFDIKFQYIFRHNEHYICYIGIYHRIQIVHNIMSNIYSFEVVGRCSMGGQRVHLYHL